MIRRTGVSSSVWIAVMVVAIIVVGAGTYIFSSSTLRPSTETLTQTLTQTTTQVSTQTTSQTFTQTVTQTPTQTTGRQYKLALVLGGDETDAGWSAIAIQAANTIKVKYNWQVDISRDVPFPDQNRVLTDYAQRGYDLVWAHGGQFIGDTFKVAHNFNDTFFAQTPGPANYAPPNVVSLGPSFQVTGFYQAGVLAGKMTRTGAVGVVIGQWFDYLSMETYAFKAGVNSSNPNAKVYVRVVGTWGDPSLGFQTAKSLIQTKNVDIMVQIADATGRGVITAAQQYNATVIGTVGDQAVLAPNVTMTSVMMNTTAFVQLVVQHIMDGTFKQTLGGHVVSMNLGYLAPFHSFDSVVPQSVKDLLAKTQQGIENGTIVIPTIVTQNPPPDP